MQRGYTPALIFFVYVYVWYIKLNVLTRKSYMSCFIIACCATLIRDWNGTNITKNRLRLSIVTVKQRCPRFVWCRWY